MASKVEIQIPKTVGRQDNHSAWVIGRGKCGRNRMCRRRRGRNFNHFLSPLPNEGLLIRNCNFRVFSNPFPLPFPFFGAFSLGV